MTRQPANIASLFANELVRRMKSEHTDERTEAIKNTITEHLYHERPLLDESDPLFTNLQRSPGSTSIPRAVSAWS